MQSIYEELVSAGVPLDSHESDLYAMATPQAIAIVERHREGDGRSAKMFTSEVDGKVWYDIPFAYMPWWEKRLASN